MADPTISLNAFRTNVVREETLMRLTQSLHKSPSMPACRDSFPLFMAREAPCSPEALCVDVG